FFFVNHLYCTALQKDGQVAFLCLEGEVLDLLFLALPHFIFISREGQRVARPYFDNISTLNFFLFLYARGQIEAAFCAFTLFYGLDKNAVAHNDKFLKLVVRSEFHVSKN